MPYAGTALRIGSGLLRVDRSLACDVPTFAYRRSEPSEVIIAGVD